MTRHGETMAKSYFEADQGNYQQLTGMLSAYGIYNPDGRLFDEVKQDFTAEELNQKLPMIHFNRYHQDENGKPAGTAKVLKVSWVAPAADGRGIYPYVRLRDLPYGAVGTANTSRKRHTLKEILENLKKD
jgi:hypothetical protein